MLDIIYKLYAYLFGKKIFINFNKFMYQLSIRGLGILNYQNAYLTGERAWLSRYLKDKKNPVVLDVGANIGSYSNDVFTANSESFIIAFEPHPVSFSILKKNVKHNNFKAVNAGVSDIEGNIELYDYESNDGSSHASLYKDVIQDLRGANPVSHTVSTVALDKFLKKENIDCVDLLKIDTEGNEYKVLIGVSEYIYAGKIKAIQFEFNEMNIISKVSFKDFWDLLSKYRFYRILPGGGLIEIKNYYPLTTEIYAFQNIVAILNTDKGIGK